MSEQLDNIIHWIKCWRCGIHLNKDSDTSDALHPSIANHFLETGHNQTLGEYFLKGTEPGATNPEVTSMITDPNVIQQQQPQEEPTGARVDLPSTQQGTSTAENRTNTVTVPLSTTQATGTVFGLGRKQNIVSENKGGQSQQE